MVDKVGPIHVTRPTVIVLLVLVVALVVAVVVLGYLLTEEKKKSGTSKSPFTNFNATAQRVQSRSDGSGSGRDNLIGTRGDVFSAADSWTVNSREGNDKFSMDNSRLDAGDANMSKFDNKSAGGLDPALMRAYNQDS